MKTPPCILSFCATLLAAIIPCSEARSEDIDPAHATGYVYHDANADGIKQADEPGLANVAVSNGHDVTLTNESGHYTLTVSEDTALFVIKPANWTLPVNEQNLPQFYYLHKPNGSPPNLKYAGVAPTGPLPESVDFGLFRRDADEEFRVLVFGDPQPKTLEEIAFFDEDIITEVTDIQGVDFGITLGDIVSDNLDHFDPMNEAIAKTGIPFFYVCGNHDINFDVDHDHLSDETFERVYGPATYAFNHGKALFIILDNVVYPSKNNRYIGGFTEKQLNFIDNVLQTVPKETLIVLSMHIPLFEQPGFGDTFRDEDRDQLFALLKDFPQTFSLSAHTHSQRHHFFTAEENWPQDNPHHHYNVATTSGSWWSGPLNERSIPDRTMHDGTAAGYAFLNIDGTELTYDYKVANEPPENQMRIYTVKVMRRSDYRTPIIANIYNATEKAKVHFKVTSKEGARWTRMKRTEIVDPHYMRLMLERDLSEAPGPGARLGFPSLSKHIWRGNLPKKLTVGEHTVQIRFEDLFGRTFTQSTKFRVED